MAIPLEVCYKGKKGEMHQIMKHPEQIWSLKLVHEFEVNWASCIELISNLVEKLEPMCTLNRYNWIVV